jgi:predicted HD phosphohydrolase
MATRSVSVFSSSPVLFQSLPQSLIALEQTSIKKILNEMPSYPIILAQLQEQGLFLDKQPTDYTIQQFLETHLKTNLDQSSFQLLMKPLPEQQSDKTRLALAVEYPKELPHAGLRPKIDCYIDVLCDVLSNQLAQKPYEQLSDRENVTEREHGLQAGKIAYLLGMDLDDVLALLFHDIARPSVNDPKYADVHHAREGGIILLPLGLSIDYSSSHAFAKYILHAFSPAYRELLSATSLRTLSLQAKDLSGQLGELNALNDSQLADAIYKIVLMRVIDDQSKAPTAELTQRLQGNKPDYFTDEGIKKMLHTQMAMHLARLTKSGIEKTMSSLEAKLDASIALLLRVKEHSLHPDLYEKHHQIIDSFPGHSPRMDTMP